MENAITTADLFRLLSLSIGRKKEATPYMVAKVLGVSPNTASLWKKGYTVMDDVNAEKAAELLSLDLEFVILSLEAERKNKSGLDKIAAIFERAALASQGRAASIFIAVFALSALPFIAKAGPQLCILCKTFTQSFNAPRSARRRLPPAGIRPFFPLLAYSYS